jgi:hypothetical protein
VQHWRPPITGWNFPSKGIIVDVDDPDGAHPILKIKWFESKGHEDGWFPAARVVPLG